MKRKSFTSNIILIVLCLTTVLASSTACAAKAAEVPRFLSTLAIKSTKVYITKNHAQRYN